MYQLEGLVRLQAGAGSSPVSGTFFVDNPQPNIESLAPSVQFRGGKRDPYHRSGPAIDSKRKPRRRFAACVASKPFS
jgi:hypothetical protein